MKTLKIIQTILNSYKSRSWNVLIVFIISYIIMGFVVIFIVGAVSSIRINKGKHGFIGMQVHSFP